MLKNSKHEECFKIYSSSFNPNHFILQNSKTTNNSIHTKKLTIQIVFADKYSSERIQLIDRISLSDWKDSISRIEFSYHDSSLNIRGTCIYAPFQGDAEINDFKSVEALSLYVNQLKSTFKIGDRLIFDNLRDGASKKPFSPIIYTLKI